MKKLLLIILVFSFHSCSNWYLLHEEQIIGDYYIVAQDSPIQMSVSYKGRDGGYSSIVDSGVFEVGHNEDFIIIKQHPIKSEQYSLNTQITNYYIITIDNSCNEKERGQGGLIGPLTEKNFRKKRAELIIPTTLDFDVIIEENK